MAGKWDEVPEIEGISLYDIYREPRALVSGAVRIPPHHPVHASRGRPLDGFLWR